MNLYPIQQQHLQLLSIVEDNEGEVTEEIDNALQITQEQFKEQALSVAYVVKHLEDREALIKKEIDRLKSLQTRTTSAAAGIELRLKQAMQQFGITEIKGDTLKISFRKSEQVLVDEDTISKEWCTQRTYYTPNKNAIKEAIKEGREIPGATLITNQNLQIK